MSNRRKKSESRNAEPHDIIINGVTVMTVETHDFAELEKEAETVEDLGDLPEDIPAEKEPEQIPPFEIEETEILTISEELEKLKNIVANLSHQNNVLIDNLNAEKTENQKIWDELHKAKQQQKKVLTLEEAEALFQKKNKLIRNLRFFETTLKEIETFGDFAPIQDNPIQTDTYRLKIEKTSRYKEGEAVFSTNNITVICEAVDVVKNSINEKIEELKTEISTIDF